MQFFKLREVDDPNGRNSDYIWRNVPKDRNDSGIGDRKYRKPTPHVIMGTASKRSPMKRSDVPGKPTKIRRYATNRRKGN